MRPFARPARHKVAHGGRGGGKSQTIATMLVLKGIEKPIRWLCTREVQKSIKESVHRLLSDTIRRLGLESFYETQETTIKGANGTEFLFAGLRDHTIESIKSYEGCDGAWIEEANKVSSKSANVLIPTIRKDGSELWWSFNPDQDTDYVYDRFVKHADEDAVVVEINWRDNPWFPSVLDVERRKLKAINSDLYDHVWEGKLRTLAGLLFKRRWFKFYDELPANLSRYMASDYAGAPDPDSEREPDFTEHGVAGLNETGDLYLIDWYSDQTDPEQWIDAAVAMIRRNSPKVWFEEKGVLLRALDASITKRLREKQCLTAFRYPLASAGSKAERALGFAARASAGTVYLPRNQPWAERLLNQLCAFTGEDGKHDDGVDVCSLLARGLDVMANARKPDEDTRKPIVPFTRSWIEASEREAEMAEAERREFYR
jgi:predicted phage terminase large subunit-like protein